MAEFDSDFKELTGHPPFPWQKRLYRLLADGVIPESCNLPTGLGKTSVIAVWLLARKANDKLPRRLVYVVNRRTVVDQTTTEVEKYRNNREAAKVGHFAVSTLRGQFADNREWSEDPSVPAVVSGTVDMIGSRLLFGGYGIGRNARPLHAGFLGQDALLVHDEAHLEPAFQKCLEQIKEEQDRCGEFRPLQVMELTATSRGSTEPFELDAEDRGHPVVRQRLTARKSLRLHANRDPKKLADELADLALEHRDAAAPVIVFAQTVEMVLSVQAALTKHKLPVVTLTGTMRGLERDRLVEHEVFRRFLPETAGGGPTVYLVCTSAGEVGVNLSARHLVCDLSTYEGMAQRFGRVNRFGDFDDTLVDVVHPTEFKADDPRDQARGRTLELLVSLNGDASPQALGKLDPEARQKAFSPTPTLVPLTDILLDNWALTTLRDELPGRPPVEPYLHGLSDYEPPRTEVAWREEVAWFADRVTDDNGDVDDERLRRMHELHPPRPMLELYPLRPQEVLGDRTDRVQKQLEELAKRHPKQLCWLVDPSGNVSLRTLAQLADKDGDDSLGFKTIVLAPRVGGLENGMLSGKADPPEVSLDVSEVSLKDDEGKVTYQRFRHKSGHDLAADKAGQLALMGCCLTLTADNPDAEEDDAAPEAWSWYTRRNEGRLASRVEVTLKAHVGQVEQLTDSIARTLEVADDLRQALTVAARVHDHGKKRAVFQRVLGRTPGTEPLAKSAAAARGRLQVTYRHEFGSLFDLEGEPAFQSLADDLKELVRHVVAAHHGRARPHFPADEVFDPDQTQAEARTLAERVPVRFAALQRRHGRWGLAYLESLLRAADWKASADPQTKEHS